MHINQFNIDNIYNYLHLNYYKFHMNDIFVDIEKYKEFYILFHQFLKNDDNFFEYMRMTKLNLYYELENIRELFVERIGQ